MKRILLLTIVAVLFVMGTSSVFAQSGDGKGKGGGQGKEKAAAVRESAEKGQAEADDAMQDAEEKAKGAERKARERVRDREGKGRQDADEAVEDAKGKGKVQGKPEGKGLGKDQKAASQAQQLEREAQKHEARQERLLKMLDVAKEKGDEKAVERIHKLMDKERGRYNRKRAKMTARGDTESGGKADKAKKETDDDAPETDDDGE